MSNNRVVGSVEERRFWILRPIINRKDRNLYAPIGILAERRNDADEFECIIAPIWENYDNKYGFNIEDYPIYGVNMSLHKDEYIYDSRYPSTLLKRTPTMNNLNPLYFPLHYKLKSNWWDPFDILRVTTGSSVDELRFLYIQPDKKYQLYNRENIPKLEIPENASTFTITEEELNEIRDK